MVECLTLERGVAGLSLIVCTVLCLEQDTLNPLYTTGSTQEASLHDKTIVNWDVEHQLKEEKKAKKPKLFTERIGSSLERLAFIFAR